MTCSITRRKEFKKGLGTTPKADRPMAIVLIHVHALRHRLGLQPHSIPQCPHPNSAPLSMEASQ
jgi:hypothetical protein